MPRGRRVSVCIGAIAALVALLVAPAAPARTTSAAAARDGRPNILVIMTDDEALNDVRRMPNVRKLLERRGTTFSNAVDSFPLCCPSRSTFITGQYAHNHGVAGNFYPYGWQGLKGKKNTLPVWLQRAGYNTALIGKWLNGYGALQRREIPPGFSQWRGLLDVSAYDYFNFMMNDNGRLRTWGDADYANALVDFARIEASPGVKSIADVLKKANEVFRPGWFGTQETKNYSPDVTAGVTEGLVRGQAKAKRPFFIWWAPAAPHREDVNGAIRMFPGRDPRPAPRYASEVSRFKLPRPPNFNEPELPGKPRLIRELPRINQAQLDKLQLDYEGRTGSLLAVDDHVAKLVRLLKETKQLKNTLIVFVSDNGWIQGQHRIQGDKFVPYEESIRIPFIVRGPGVRAGSVVRRQVSNVDFAPTLLDAARARPGRTMDGVSLLPATRNPDHLPRRVVELEATGPLFAVEGFPMAYDKPYTGVRTQRFKYVRWSYGDEELYDLRTDRYELNNVVNDPRYAQVKKRLAADLKRLRRCKGSSCTVAP